MSETEEPDVRKEPLPDYYAQALRNSIAIVAQRTREEPEPDEQIGVAEQIARLIQKVEPGLGSARIWRVAIYLVRSGALSSMEGYDLRSIIAAKDTELLRLQALLKAYEEGRVNG